MSPENMAEPFIDGILKIVEKVDLAKSTKAVVTSCKEKYTQVMDSYSDFLDQKFNLSPNRIGTLRVGAGVITGLFLANGDHGTTIESLGVGLLIILLGHDAVDGHQARHTQQTSKAGETFDAGADKVKVYALLSILIYTMDVNPAIILSLVGAAGYALFLDIKSQLMRDNNIEAIKAFWKAPLTQEERDNNPNEKSSGASVKAGKAKTGVVMTGITLGFMEDIPMFEWTDENAILLGVSLAVSSLLAVKSLRQKKAKQLEQKT